jgi:hypothetical protein
MDFTKTTLVLATIGFASFSFASPYFKSGNETVCTSSTGSAFILNLPEKLSQTQTKNICYSHEIAVQDGHKYPDYIGKIILQESKAGDMKTWRVAGLSNRHGDRYFGIGQVKLIAAKAVMKRYPYLWNLLNTHTDEELQARLILDDRFNIRIVSKYALMMGINTNPAKALAAYNLGPSGSKNVDHKSFHYTRAVAMQ